MRILVTGSRKFTDAHAVQYALLDEWLKADRPMLTIVHGDCPTGADAIAAEVAVTQGFIAEPHPPKREFGNRGFYLRNKEMVDAGADVCLAFLKTGAGNVGTAMTITLAEKAGIPVKRFIG